MAKWCALAVAQSVGRVEGFNEDSAGAYGGSGCGETAAVYVADGVGSQVYAGSASRAVGNVYMSKVNEIIELPRIVKKIMDSVKQDCLSNSNNAESLVKVVSRLHMDIMCELDAGLGARALTWRENLKQFFVSHFSKIIGKTEKREASTTMLYALAVTKPEPTLYIGYTGDGYIVAANCANKPLPVLPKTYASLLAPTVIPQIGGDTARGECVWLGDQEYALSRTCRLEDKKIDKKFVETFVECCESDHVSMTLTVNLSKSFYAYILVLATDGARLDEELDLGKVSEIAKAAAGEGASRLAYSLYKSLSCLQRLGYTSVTRAYVALLAGCLAVREVDKPERELEVFIREMLKRTNSGDDRSMAMLIVSRSPEDKVAEKA